MRFTKFALVAVFSFVLTACVTSLVVGNAQSKLMWAMLKPLVGFDPNEVNLFEQPMIKNRMVKLLGPHYDTTMKLLRTANEIQQEGALFYVVSRYTPLPGIAKQTAEKAGFVWNADTNQMAVMLVTGGAPTVIAEQVENARMAIMPSWPTELQAVIDGAESTQKALQDAVVDKTTEMVGETLGLEGDQPLLEQVIESGLNGESVGDAVQEHIQQSSDKIIEDTIAPARETLEQHVPEAVTKPLQDIEDTRDAISEKMEQETGQFEQMEDLIKEWEKLPPEENAPDQ
ncbi:hypothetical protein [Cellvibrio sp. PSBB006]|uniref:hypothetical protein n=1 Tax=Cellvibrio sp. PSBB006 TaxID=1987723 RepID=UPI0018DF11CF|nr:hypothetical protein [Cellvibrio sp. PSBB006]